MKVQFFKNLIGLLMGIAIFLGITQTLNYLYQAADDEKYRILWHDYYENCGKIENIYIGSSHVYRSIDPWVTSELSGEHCFNMASSGQKLNGSYYLLKEAVRGNELKHVYVDLYYMLNTVDKGGVDPIEGSYSHNWHNTDYMRCSANKIAYMLSFAEPERYLDIIFPFCRYREKLGDWDYIKQVMEDKQALLYRVSQNDVNRIGGGYLGRGFWGSEKVYEDRNKCWGQNRVLAEQPMGDESREYLHKIIQYCQKKNILITLFVSPINDLQLISTVNYDNYVNEIKVIAATYNIPFYDFNLAKEEYLPIRQGKYYMDAWHLNTEGAKLFTPFFYQVVSQEESENAEYFCDSYKERLGKSKPAIYGIYYKEPEEESQTARTYKNTWIASSRDSGMEYRIVLTPEGGEGEPYLVQDFDENKAFQTPLDEEGICTVTTRITGTADELQTMEIYY